MLKIFSSIIGRQVPLVDSPTPASVMLRDGTFWGLAGVWAKLAPFRILSVDIECAGRKVHCLSFLLCGTLNSWRRTIDPGRTSNNASNHVIMYVASLPGSESENAGRCAVSRMVVLQGHFPDAKQDPVIQVASMVTVQGESSPIVRNVMTLHSCAHIVGAEVMSFESERELLLVCPLACLPIADSESI
jgi:hypothetical protein